MILRDSKSIKEFKTKTTKLGSFDKIKNHDEILKEIFALREKLTKSNSNQTLDSKFYHELSKLVKLVMLDNKDLKKEYGEGYEKYIENCINNFTEYTKVNNNHKVISLINDYLLFIYKLAISDPKDAINKFSGFHGEIKNCVGGMNVRIKQYLPFNLLYTELVYLIHQKK